jgi:hypothetical protein
MRPLVEVFCDLELFYSWDPEQFLAGVANHCRARFPVVEVKG